MNQLLDRIEPITTDKERALLQNVTVTETLDQWTLQFPTRSQYLRARLNPQLLTALGQAFPDRPITMRHT